MSTNFLLCAFSLLYHGLMWISLPSLPLADSRRLLKPLLLALAMFYLAFHSILILKSSLLLSAPQEPAKVLLYDFL